MKSFPTLQAGNVLDTPWGSSSGDVCPLASIVCDFFYSGHGSFPAVMSEQDVRADNDSHERISLVIIVDFCYFL